MSVETKHLRNRLETILQNLTAALLDKGYDVKNRGYGYNMSGTIEPPDGCGQISIDVAAIKDKWHRYSYPSQYRDQFRVSISQHGRRLRRFAEPKRGFGDNVTNYLVDLFESQLRYNKVREEQNLNHATAAEWANELDKKHRLKYHSKVRVTPLRVSGDPKVEVVLNVRVSKEEADQLLKAFRRVARAPGCKSIVEKS